MAPSDLRCSPGTSSRTRFLSVRGVAYAVLAPASKTRARGGEKRSATLSTTSCSKPYQCPTIRVLPIICAHASLPTGRLQQKVWNTFSKPLLRTVIIFKTLLSLYAFAPSNFPPSTCDNSRGSQLRIHYGMETREKVATNAAVS